MSVCRMWEEHAYTWNICVCISACSLDIYRALYPDQYSISLSLSVSLSIRMIYSYFKNICRQSFGAINTQFVT